VGSIEVGKRADLVVLTDDIMQVPPERIHKADVVLTMVDGRLVYESKAVAESTRSWQNTRYRT
jgi:hypothetical protein